jgi:hypothetical protein
MNGKIFLSASVPTPDRAEERYFATANPFLIRLAVQELVRVVVGKKKLVWASGLHRSGLHRWFGRFVRSWGWIMGNG